MLRPRKKRHSKAVGPPSLLMAKAKEKERPPSYWNVAPDLFMSDMEFDLRQKQSYDFSQERKTKGETPASRKRLMLQRRASVLGYNDLNRSLRFPMKHRDQMETDTESESDDEGGRGGVSHRPSVQSAPQSLAAESTAATLRSARLSVHGDQQADLFPEGLRRGDYLGKQAKARYFDVYRRVLRKGRTVPLHLPLDDVVKETLGASLRGREAAANAMVGGTVRSVLREGGATVMVGG